MSILLLIEVIKKFVPVFLLGMCFTITSAQEVIIKAELDTNRALIGDQLRLSLSVEKPADIDIDFPMLKDTISHKIEIVRDSYTDTTSVAKGRVTFSRNLVITVFDTGFFEIPPLNFVTYSGHSRDTISTLPVSFEILPVKSDSTLRDIKKNFKAPLNLAEIYSWMKENYLYVLMAVALGLLIWFIVRYIRKKLGRGKDKTQEIYAELPEVIALRELEKIKDERPWKHNKVKLYHIRLSEILRNYIEGRFIIMALEQTTEEILIALKSTVCKPADFKCLAGILRLADLVKFAKVIPSDEENEGQIDLASEFVRNTSFCEEENPQEGDAQKNMIPSTISSGNA